ncbi:MAG: hypothetical protein WCA28_07185, partial [Bradyrhizobium sp.]
GHRLGPSFSTTQSSGFFSSHAGPNSRLARAFDKRQILRVGIINFDTSLQLERAVRGSRPRAKPIRMGHRTSSKMRGLFETRSAQSIRASGDTCRTN